MNNPRKIKEMFDSIAPTYDLLNHLLSFGLDIRWRKKAVKLLKEKKYDFVLDIAAGSGDFSLEVLKIKPIMVVASDFSENMLETCRQKLNKKGINKVIKLINCDALKLPFKTESFDVAITAYGIRNFADKYSTLREMLRVIKSNGVSIILELTQPTSHLILPLYKVYSQTIIPLVGKLISRNNKAYRYLPESISNFSKAHEFAAIMKEAGFTKVDIHPLSFGIATIFIGKKNN